MQRSRKNLSLSETTPTSNHSQRRGCLYFAGIALFAVTAATAQVSIDASGNYQDEVRACRSGQTQQCVATCR